MTDLNDLELLRRMRAGDASAASMLWMRLSPRLLAFATAVLRDRALAEDVVQGVFVRAVEFSEAEVASIGDLLAYLAKAAQHAALNVLRSEGRAAKRAAFAVLAGTSIDDHSVAAADEELARRVDELPDLQREVVLLRHVAGLSFAQIAESLDENQNTVAGRYRAALERLRARLVPPLARSSENRHV